MAQTQYLANSDYESSIPTPPRIIVPPPAWCTNALSGINRIDKSRPRSYESVQTKQLEFLKTVTDDNYKPPAMLQDWVYGWRRNAQKILPFLYLGPMGAIRDRQFLRSEGITMLLAIRDSRSAQARLLDGTKVAQELGIVAETVDVANNQGLIAALPSAVELINNHLMAVYKAQLDSRQKDGNNASTAVSGNMGIGKVLLFCESGNDRSAAVVVAYIMSMYSIDMVESIQLVQSQRFCAAFDDEMKNLLFAHGSIVNAKRDVASASQMTEHAERSHSPAGNDLTKEVGLARKPSKRNVEEVYDIEMEMDGADGLLDQARFDQRNAFVPFQDRLQ